MVTPTPHKVTIYYNRHSPQTTTTTRSLSLLITRSLLNSSSTVMLTNDRFIFTSISMHTVCSTPTSRLGRILEKKRRREKDTLTIIPIHIKIYCFSRGSTLRSYILHLSISRNRKSMANACERRNKRDEKIINNNKNQHLRSTKNLRRISKFMHLNKNKS